MMIFVEFNGLRGKVKIVETVEYVMKRIVGSFWASCGEKVGPINRVKCFCKFVNVLG